ncbi:MAG: chorismate mutase [Candidatus Atribacteria bacterium]|nr:chorismate mutase [Candidatus Atribacteria bacterium]
MMVRGIRGAITVDHDEKDEIKSATLNLFQAILVQNQLSPSDISCVFITATPDISSVFPAEAIREIEDFRYVPVLCAQEIDVKGAMPRCVRMLVLAMTRCEPREIKHVYLRGAQRLRQDLCEERKTQ